MKLSTRAQILLLTFVILGVYYPAIFGDYNSVDDRLMVTKFLNQLPDVNWIRLFTPSQKFYYRPLLLSTYVADGLLWGFLPFFMHLENILLHAANTLLVFFLARHIFFDNNPASASASASAPLLAGLLFGLHPIVTESTCWISGRTDLLGTFFVLLSFLMLVYALREQKGWMAVLASVLMVAAVMSKEVMLFFLPFAIFLIIRWPLLNPEVVSFRRRLVLAGIYSLPFTLAAAGYGFVRVSAYGAADKGFKHILHNFSYDSFSVLRVVFKVMGFYVKKLFSPWPNNFAIVQASNHYVWLGLLVLLFILYALFNRKLSLDLLVVSFGLITPAIVIALTRVAWTPLAERYLYLPAVFWALGVTLCFFNLVQYGNVQKIMVPVVFLLLIPLGWSSASRAMIWKDNLALYQDTINKSPGFLPLYNEYAVALAEHGYTSEAQEYLEMGRDRDENGSVLSVHTNEAALFLQEGRVSEALDVLDDYLSSRNDKLSLLQLKGLAKICEQIALKKNTPEQLERTNSLLTSLYNRIYSKTKDPFVRYRQGQIAMYKDERKKAAEYFFEAYQKAPDSSHYKQAARVLAAKMEEGR